MTDGTPSELEVMTAIYEAESPVLNTSELAREFDYSPTGMKTRLETISDRYIRARECGGMTIWWLTEEGRDVVSREFDVSNLKGRTTHE